MDPGTRSIRFGYFHMKGHRIYTCLSHDVITHEFGHAVLDGLKPLRFMVREGYFEDETDGAHAVRRARATIGPDGVLHVARNAAARCAIRRQR